MLWKLIVVVLIIWLIQRRWLMRRQIALAKQIKSNMKIWPVIGHAYKCMGTEEDKMIEIIQDIGKDAIGLGGMSSVYLYDQPIICVADPAIAQIVLNKCLDKHPIMKLMDFLIGSSSIIAPVSSCSKVCLEEIAFSDKAAACGTGLSVSTWRLRRKIISSFFHTRHLVTFFDLMSKQSAGAVNALKVQVNNGAFSILESISTYTSNVLYATILGIGYSSTNVESDNFKTAITELWDFLNYLAYRPWLWPKFLRNFLPSYGKTNEQLHTAWGFVTKIIKDKRKRMEMKTNKTIVMKEKASVAQLTSFLDIQLEAPERQRFSDKELVEESITLYVAGSDTTSVSISYIILILCRHLDVQDKLYQELQDVFDNSDRPVELEDLSRLQYLEAVIKETLRLYPPVPAIGRQADKDVELPSGITLVEGCGIMINIWAVHRNPAYWGDDADQFRPERFLNYTPKHPAAFMAFSYGSRDCIGIRLAMMSMKTVLATLFRRYRALPPPGVQQGEPLRTKFSMMMRHADNYLIRLELRK